MAKKKSKKKEEPVKKSASKPTKPEPADDEKPFDFGGLPQRDLKKNLGCG
jgi:hypothetical protein